MPVLVARPKLAGGTGGMFGSFGTGTAAVLHGLEAIVPRVAVPSLAQDLAAALSQLAGGGLHGATAGGPPMRVEAIIGDSQLDQITNETIRRSERLLDFDGRS